MLRIEVADSQPNIREFVKDGQTLTFKEQTIYVHLPGQKYPLAAILSLGKDQIPYPAGNYELDLLNSIYIDRYRKLALGSLVLIETPEPKK